MELNAFKLKLVVNLKIHQDGLLSPKTAMGTLVNSSLPGRNLWFPWFHFSRFNFSIPVLIPCMQQRWENHNVYSCEHTKLNSAYMFLSLASLDEADGLLLMTSLCARMCSRRPFSALVSFRLLYPASLGWAGCMAGLVGAWVENKPFQNMFC